MQRFRLDQSSKVEPLTLLEKISEKGISQDVCINDLGMKLGFLVVVLVQNRILFFFFLMLLCLQSLLHLKFSLP